MAFVTPSSAPAVVCMRFCCICFIYLSVSDRHRRPYRPGSLRNTFQPIPNGVCCFVHYLDTLLTLPPADHLSVRINRTVDHPIRSKTAPTAVLLLALKIFFIVAILCE